jgi:hypothetical protein
MSEEDSGRSRRSTRLPISIPVVVSGVDADGMNFRESAHTLVVNKHGGKIALIHRLLVGSEVLIENHALGVSAKASVAWVGDKQYPGDLSHVGLQLLEAQNVWGIAFPPDDWSSQPQMEPSLPVSAPPAAQHAGAVSAETLIPSPAGEEITLRLLQELQESADSHVRKFQDRLMQLAHQVGLEFEFDLRERAAFAKAHEVGALEEQIKALSGNLALALGEIRKLEGEIQELKATLLDATGSAPLATPMQEAQRQLSALTNSVVENMNRAAGEGLEEYRALLKKENQDTAALLSAEAGINLQHDAE